MPWQCPRHASRLHSKHIFPISIHNTGFRIKKAGQNPLNPQKDATYHNHCFDSECEKQLLPKSVNLLLQGYLSLDNLQTVSFGGCFILLAQHFLRCSKSLRRMFEKYGNLQTSRLLVQSGHSYQQLWPSDLMSEMPEVGEISHSLSQFNHIL